MEHNRGNYTLNQLALVTGLTERTLRTYIASGILEGEKISGKWYFTSEQVDRFIRHPSVRLSILAKQNALVYDFLLDTHKLTCETCVVLDVPGSEPETLAGFFCHRINNGNFRNIHFAYDGAGSVPRVILTGEAGAVLQLVNEYKDALPFS